MATFWHIVQWINFTGSVFRILCQKMCRSAALMLLLCYSFYRLSSWIRSSLTFRERTRNSRTNWRRWQLLLSMGIIQASWITMIGKSSKMSPAVRHYDLNFVQSVTHQTAFFFSAAMTRNPWRKSFPRGSSVTSVTASTSTTQRTVPHKCRCPTPPHTPPTTAVRAKNVPTATSVRSLATGPTPVTTTRPFEAYISPSFAQSLYLHIALDYAVLLGFRFVCVRFRVLVFAKRLRCPRQSLSALTGERSPPLSKNSDIH